VSLWGEKSSTTTSLTSAPGTQRYTGCTTGSGHICSLVKDMGPVAAGSTAGGLVATADVAGSTDTMWTLVLAPQQ
jgi:hypothetical protein